MMKNSKCKIAISCPAYIREEKKSNKSTSSRGSTSGLRPVIITNRLLSSKYEHSFHISVIMIQEELSERLVSTANLKVKLIKI